MQAQRRRALELQTGSTPPPLSATASISSCLIRQDAVHRFRRACAGLSTARQRRLYRSSAGWPGYRRILDDGKANAPPNASSAVAGRQQYSRSSVTISCSLSVTLEDDRRRSSNTSDLACSGGASGHAFRRYSSKDDGCVSTFLRLQLSFSRRFSTRTRCNPSGVLRLPLRLARFLRLAPLVRALFSSGGLRYAAIFTVHSANGGAAFASVGKFRFGNGIY